MHLFWTAQLCGARAALAGSQWTSTAASCAGNVAPAETAHAAALASVHQLYTQPHAASEQPQLLPSAESAVD